MDRADEDHPQADPEQAGQPPELLARQDGSADGPRGGDGAEVLAEEVEGPGGHEVHPVVLRHRGSGNRIVQDELPSNETAVEAVCQRQQHEDGASHQREVCHFCSGMKTSPQNLSQSR